MTLELSRSWFRSMWCRVHRCGKGEREWWSQMGSFGDDWFGEEVDGLACEA
jgi:hypothetical protein